MEIIDISPTLLAASPIILGVVSMVKGLGVPSKWAPLISIALGIGAAALLGGTPFVIVMSGIVVGLTASGLYSGAKATING